jgi:multidrug efflux pump subunit AcrB
VTVVYNGASVSVMRDNIVSPIEQNLAGSTDLQTINSVVQQGRATISAVYTLGSDIATDLTLTQKAVQNASKELPTNLTAPTVAINDPSESVVITLALSSKKLSPGQLSLYVDNTIAPRIQQIPGVSFANVIGDVTPAYEVEVDPFRLLSQGLTLTDVIGAVSNQNNRVPGGIAYEPDRETTIDVRGDITDLNSVARLPIAPPSTNNSTSDSDQQGRSTRPSAASRRCPATSTRGRRATRCTASQDVAHVVAGYEPVRRIAQISGKAGPVHQHSEGLGRERGRGFAERSRATAGPQAAVPRDRLQVINTQSKFTQQQIDLVTRTLMESILLTGSRWSSSCARGATRWSSASRFRPRSRSR